MVVGVSIWLGVWPGLHAVFTRRFEGQVEFRKSAPIQVLEGGAAMLHGGKLLGFGLLVIAGVTFIEWWIQRDE
jgi:hypothetical protein